MCEKGATSETGATREDKNIRAVPLFSHVTHVTHVTRHGTWQGEPS